MILSCEKSYLQSACMTASRAAAAKSPIPALEGLLLETCENRLKVTGYDLKKGIYTSLDADIKEAGKVVVNSKLFCEMLRKLPDGIVSLSCDDNNSINVKCGRTQFNIMGIEDRDYPELPEIDEKNSAVIPQKILKSMINQTIFAISDNDARPIYTGSLFEIEDNTLTVVSIDGYRLAKRTEKLESERMDSCSFVVPGYALNDIEKICSDEDDKKTVISVGDKHISFELENTVLITRRLEGEFLNYKKSIPETFKYTLEIEKTDMMATIDRVSLIISDKNTSPVRMTISDGRINCLCITSIGKAEDVCFCQGDAEGMEIGFNDRYFMDALKASGKDKLKMYLNTPSSPCVLKAADGTENFVYMILPVRLKAGD